MIITVIPITGLSKYRIDSIPPITNTILLIDMAIAAITTKKDRTASRIANVTKYDRTVRMTIIPDLERIHTDAKAITIRGVMIPYNNRRAMVMEVVALIPGWIRVRTSTL